MTTQPSVPEPFPRPQLPTGPPQSQRSYPLPPSSFGLPVGDAPDVAPRTFERSSPANTAPTQPTVTPTQAQTGTKPSSYWPITIIAVLFSIIIGAVGIFFSIQVNMKWNAGDAVGAKKSSNLALGFGIAGIAIGLILLSTYAV